MTIPATIAADQAVAKQNFALSALKHSAEQEQAFAQVIQNAIRSAPTSGTHGIRFDSRV